jgi:hypothetical protein
MSDTSMNHELKHEPKPATFESVDDNETGTAHAYPSLIECEGPVDLSTLSGAPQQPKPQPIWRRDPRHSPNCAMTSSGASGGGRHPASLSTASLSDSNNSTGTGAPQWPHLCRQDYVSARDLHECLDKAALEMMCIKGRLTMALRQLEDLEDALARDGKAVGHVFRLAPAWPWYQAPIVQLPAWPW